jgi:hypothetical protein
MSNATEHCQYFQEQETSDLRLFGHDVPNLGTENTSEVDIRLTPRNCGSVPSRAQQFTIPQSVQNVSGAQTASHSVGSRVPSLGARQPGRECT